MTRSAKDIVKADAQNVDTSAGLAGTTLGCIGIEPSILRQWLLASDLLVSSDTIVLDTWSLSDSGSKTNEVLIRFTGDYITGPTGMVHLLVRDLLALGCFPIPHEAPFKEIPSEKEMPAYIYIGEEPLYLPVILLDLGKHYGFNEIEARLL